VQDADQVQREIAVVGGLLDARESDARGYVAIGDASDLTALHADDAGLAQALATLASMVRGDADQTRLVTQLRSTLAGMPALPATAAVASWMSSERAVNASAHRQLAAIQDAELASSRRWRALAQTWRTAIGFGVAGLLLIGVLGGLFGVRLFTRSIARRVDRLEADLDGVDLPRADPPDDSADELGRLSRRLRSTVEALGRRESELREARTFFESIVTVGPVVVIRTVDGAVTYVSPNAERVLGVEVDRALSPRFWLREVTAETVDRFNAAAARLFEPDAPEVAEFEGEFGRGEGRRHVSCLVTRETASGGGHGIFAYVLDITARRNAEHEGAQRQRELSAITAASPDIIAVFSADLHVSFVSEATTSITGYRVGDRVGHEAGDAVHPEDRQLLVDAIRSVISGAAEDFTVRVRAKHVSGRYMLLEGHGRPLLGSDGAPVAAVAIFRDIGDRVALEAALVEARDAADAASRAKSEFLSRMSHELRTPLNVVLGFAQLLQMETIGEEQRSWVDQVLKAGRHLLDLINEVLDIARIESGALSLSPEPVSLRDVVGETVESLRPMAAANDITIDFLIEGDDLYVRADRQRLKQVLLNLLANSVKYNRPRGSVLVTSKTNDAHTVAIRVSDTGIGIAAEHIERLFVPFDRLGAESSGVEGTGVGLSLSLRLVQAMEGELSVVSTPGEGSTFVVVLPSAAGPEDLAQEVVIADAERQMTFDEGYGARGTLLYIEDNLTNLHLMQRIVARRPGVRLLHASHGRMGLDLARTGHADVILLDLHLPDMSGAEVLRRLRAEATTSDVPVYIVSADATAGQVGLMRSAGAVGYLTKPLDVRRVLELLDAVLEDGVRAREGE
jgi:PAS domain S-box-containing protein